jgi:hypothetical protein
MRVRSLAAGLVLVLGLVACSDDPGEPSALPTLGSSPSASASPEPEATPTGMNAPTPEGAAEFARHFYSQVELAYQRKDPNLIQRLSAPGCVACERFVASVSRLRDNDERVEGLLYEISFAQAPATHGKEARVDVIYDGPEVVRYDSEGRVVNREPGAVKAEEQVNLVRSPSGGWLVAEILST